MDKDKGESEVDGAAPVVDEEALLLMIALTREAERNLRWRSRHRQLKKTRTSA